MRRTGQWPLWAFAFAVTACGTALPRRNSEADGSPPIVVAFPTEAFGLVFGVSPTDAEAQCARLGRAWSVTFSPRGAPRGHCAGAASGAVPFGIVGMTFCAHTHACTIGWGLNVPLADADARVHVVLDAIVGRYGSADDQSTGAARCIADAREGHWDRVAAGVCTIGYGWSLAGGHVSLRLTATQEHQLFVLINYLSDEALTSPP